MRTLPAMPMLSPPYGGSNEPTPQDASGPQPQSPNRAAVALAIANAIAALAALATALAKLL